MEELAEGHTQHLDVEPKFDSDSKSQVFFLFLKQSYKSRGWSN